VRFFRALIPALVFFLILDIEFSVGSIGGGGERVGNSSTLVNGTLVTSQSQGIGVKVSDVLIFLLFLSTLILMGVSRVHARIGKSAGVNFLLLAGFVATSLLALVLNKGHYSQAQWLVSLAYLTKFLEVSLVVLFLSMHFRLGGDARPILKATVQGGAIAAVIGLVNPFVEIFFGWFIQDRVHYYGVLSLLSLLWFSALLSPLQVREYFGVPRMFLWAVTLCSSISVLICGKRTVAVGFICGFLYVVSCYRSIRNFRKTFALIAIFILATGPFLMEQLERSFGRESQYLWEGLSKEYSSAISDSWIASVSIPGLDYSMTERLGKWVVATQAFLSSPVIGVGFWGAPYVYNFLPDSAPFQLLVETGLIGIVLIAILFLRTWRVSRDNVRGAPGHAFGIGVRGGIIVILVMGLTANTIYIFGLFAMFLVQAALIMEPGRRVFEKPVFKQRLGI